MNWKDIREIVSIADNLVAETNLEELRDMGDEGYYQKILDRYLEKEGVGGHLDVLRNIYANADNIVSCIVKQRLHHGGDREMELANWSSLEHFLLGTMQDIKAIIDVY